MPREFALKLAHALSRRVGIGKEETLCHEINIRTLRTRQTHEHAVRHKQAFVLFLCFCVRYHVILVVVGSASKNTSVAFQIRPRYCADYISDVPFRKIREVESNCKSPKVPPLAQRNSLAASCTAFYFSKRIPYY
jgi:hypothetical protein